VAWHFLDNRGCCISLCAASDWHAVQSPAWCAHETCNRSACHFGGRPAVGCIRCIELCYAVLRCVTCFELSVICACTHVLTVAELTTVFSLLPKLMPTLTALFITASCFASIRLSTLVRRRSCLLQTVAELTKIASERRSTKQRLLNSLSASQRSISSPAVLLLRSCLHSSVGHSNPYSVCSRVSNC